ncbi:MAG TPA: polysaccharide biosynthesis/export family protein [Anaeromyxobacteraceae bacterium]|nr:polysaccharide biosynthesis/export family protein [Anaeromyxobacteraceae bacterium]
MNLLRELRHLALAAALLSGCAPVGEYFWVDALPAPDKERQGCVIRPGDTVGIRVFNQDSLSVRTKVREDGMITVPFLNDVGAAGQSPVELSRRLQTRLKDFIVNPVVTVSLEEVGPLQVSIVGEVVRPGVYQLEQGSGVLKALAVAGGMTPFADKDRIFILRRDHWADANPQPVRIRMTFQRLTQARGRAATFALHGGDVVVVE